MHGVLGCFAGRGTRFPSGAYAYAVVSRCASKRCGRFPRSGPELVRRGRLLFYAVVRRNPQNRERFVGLDWLRLWAMLAILVWHGTWFFWPEVQGPPDPFPTAFWRMLSAFAHYSSYSGFTVVFVTAFLLGQKDSVFGRKRWLPLFLFVGWIVFSVVLAVRDGGHWTQAWDVYPFLLVTLVVGDFALRRLTPAMLRAATLLSFAFLLIPFWRLQSSIPGPPYLVSVLVGLCPDDYADWPLLPWSFLVWGGMGWGALLRRGHFPRTLRNIELPFVALGLAALGYAAVDYGQCPLGDFWSCYVFRRPPWVFMAYLFGIASLVRVAVDPRVGRCLSSSALLSWPSRLGINRHFFLAYLTHYLALFAISAVILAAKTPKLWVYDLGFLVALAATELIPRYLGPKIQGERHVAR